MKYLLFLILKSSWGKLGSKLNQKCKLWERPVPVKSFSKLFEFFQNYLYDSCASVRTTHGKNFRSIWVFFICVIALKPPKMDPVGSGTKKSSFIFRLKTRTINIQKLKLGNQKLWMENVRNKGYVRIVVDSLTWPHGAIKAHFGPKKMLFFC